jgi:hypothetical protein
VASTPGQVSSSSLSSRKTIYSLVLCVKNRSFSKTETAEWVLAMVTAYLDGSEMRGGDRALRALSCWHRVTIWPEVTHSKDDDGTQPKATTAMKMEGLYHMHSWRYLITNDRATNGGNGAENRQVMVKWVVLPPLGLKVRVCWLGIDQR